LRKTPTFSPKKAKITENCDHNIDPQICETETFSGRVVRGPLAVKLPEVNFSALRYTLKAEARGKELKVRVAKMTDIKKLLFSYWDQW
jgi:hypothetical protein